MSLAVITSEQIHIIQFKHGSIGGISCLYGLAVASQLTLVEYSHILKEQPVQKVSEELQTLWARVIFTKLVTEQSSGGVNFSGFVMVCTRL